MNAIIPGSFDPVTLGHIDVIRRAARLYERVVVAVMDNSEKTCMFDADTRLEMVRGAVSELDNVEALRYCGITAELCGLYAPSVIVKGVRTAYDFDYEAMICEAGRSLGVETVLIVSSPEYCRHSSTVVREFIKYGADISHWAPQSVSDRLNKGRN